MRLKRQFGIPVRARGKASKPSSVPTIFSYTAEGRLLDVEEAVSKRQRMKVPEAVDYPIEGTSGEASASAAHVQPLGCVSSDAAMTGSPKSTSEVSHDMGTADTATNEQYLTLLFLVCCTHAALL